MKKTTRLWLRLALPSTLLCAIGVLIAYLDARAEDAVVANLYYSEALEYIFASLLITLCGAILIELAAREKK